MNPHVTSSGFKLKGKNDNSNQNLNNERTGEWVYKWMTCLSVSLSCGVSVCFNNVKPPYFTSLNVWLLKMVIEKKDISCCMLQKPNFISNMTTVMTFSILKFLFVVHSLCWLSTIGLKNETRVKSTMSTIHGNRWEQ